MDKIEYYEEQLKFYELNSQLELIDEIIGKIEKSYLNKSTDVMYSTAESAIRSIHYDLIVMQNKIFSYKHKIVQKLYELVEIEKKNRSYY